MRPPQLNQATLDALYETNVERLPEYDRWLDVPEDEIDDRYVIIGEEVFDDIVTRGFGGCWPDLADAFTSYDWNAGAPAFVVDLFAPPEKAVRPIALKPELAGSWTTFDDCGVA